jgi:hypothetical protein
MMYLGERGLPIWLEQLVFGLSGVKSVMCVMRNGGETMTCAPWYRLHGVHGDTREPVGLTPNGKHHMARTMWDFRQPCGHQATM